MACSFKNSRSYRVLSFKSSLNFLAAADNDDGDCGLRFRAWAVVMVMVMVMMMVLELVYWSHQKLRSGAPRRTAMGTMTVIPNRQRVPRGVGITIVRRVLLDTKTTLQLGELLPLLLLLLAPR